HDGKVFTPDKFIDVFEENGFIMQLDEYIWEYVCSLIRKWLDEGRTVVPVSVNVSRLDIYNKNLRGVLNGLVKKYGLSRDLLRLEITETSYMQDPEQLIGVVRQLREDGFFIEMDDFGSGYSSLNTLKDVVVDMLKLDMRFISSAEAEGRSGIILSAIVRMSYGLNIPVIAEGVETSQQADFLRDIGCVIAQGYLYARPMSVKDFEELLMAGNTGDINDAIRTEMRPYRGENK
ncbi:MAG: EAL domain-containing protein, partial [Synergistaceae bacterium]|nr:EAL domain-containing protein [Synergistaceae bacterium]